MFKVTILALSGEKVEVEVHTQKEAFEIYPTFPIAYYRVENMDAIPVETELFQEWRREEFSPDVTILHPPTSRPEEVV